MNQPLLSASTQDAFPRRFRPLALKELAEIGIAAALPQVSALLWLAQDSSSIHFRGWINVEYLLLLSLALLHPSRLMVALLTAELTIALIEPIGHLYYFSPADALHSLRYLLLIPFPRLFLYACLSIAYILGCAALLRLGIGARRRPGAVPAAGFLLLISFAAIVLTVASGRTIGHFSLSKVVGWQLGDIDMRQPHVVCVPIIAVVNDMLRLRPADGGPSLPLSSALSQGLADLPAAVQPDVVLVLTESWGLARDGPLNQAITEPYDNAALKSKYRIQSGSVQFLGATTSGETRELCGNSLGRTGSSVPSGYFSACWPMRLASAGYRTVAVHGFTPTLFSRGEWYRQFGFQQTEFLPGLERDGAALCDGAFPGACDADVARWIGKRILATPVDRPIFVHWVTLNSHLPVAPIPNERLSPDCAAAGVDGDEGLCSWLIYILRLHRSVVDLALTPGLRPTLFVIVGDHAPPFLSPARRNRFSQTSVPYLLLVPSEFAPAEGPPMH